MTLEEAAARLGMKPSELSKIESSADGPVVYDRDGFALLIRDEGVYWLGQAPNPGLPVWVEAQPEILAENGSETVPDGTAKEILAWVDGDPERAQLALDAEAARGELARSTLSDNLRKFLR